MFWIVLLFAAGELMSLRHPSPCSAPSMHHLISAGGWRGVRVHRAGAGEAEP